MSNLNFDLCSVTIRLPWLEIFKSSPGRKKNKKKQKKNKKRQNGLVIARNFIFFARRIFLKIRKKRWNWCSSSIFVLAWIVKNGYVLCSPSLQLNACLFRILWNHLLKSLLAFYQTTEFSFAISRFLLNGHSVNCN